MSAVLRSVAYLLLAILLTAPFGLLVTLAVVLPMKMRFCIIALWRGCFMALCKTVLGIDYRVVGRENIPATPSVILSKHQSAWETVGLQAIFPPQVFVLKKSLLMIDQRISPAAVSVKPNVRPSTKPRSSFCGRRCPRRWQGSGELCMASVGSAGIDRSAAVGRAGQPDRSSSRAANWASAFHSTTLVPATRH